MLLDENCKKIVMGWEFRRNLVLDGGGFMDNTSGVGIARAMSGC